MTVKELKKFLEKCCDDCEVFVERSNPKPEVWKHNRKPAIARVESNHDPADPKTYVVIDSAYH